jgi:hypothetical protein
MHLRTSADFPNAYFLVEMCRCCVGYGFEACYFVVFAGARCYI